MVYTLLAHDPVNEFRTYFIGLYASKEKALEAKKERERQTGNGVFFVNEFAIDGELKRVNVNG